MGRRAILGLLVIYGVLIPIPSDYHFGEGIRLWLFKNRPFLMVAIIVVGLVILWYRRSVSFSPEFALATLFPLWATLIAPLNGTSLPLLILYWTWPLLAFLLVPRLQMQRELFKALTLTYAALWFLILLLGRGALSGLPREDTFGFLNEDYYGQVVQLLSISALIWLFLERRRPRLMVGVYVVLTAHLLMVNARNVVVFMVVTGLFFLWFQYGRSMSGLASLPLVIFACAIFMIGYTNRYYPTGSVNDVSSGRLSIWGDALGGLSDGGRLVVLNVFVGTEGELPGAAAYDPLSEEATFTTQHIDNGWLEMFLKNGLVGLVLFLAPYVYVFRRGLRLRDSPIQSLALAIFVGGFTQGLLAATIPTFGSPSAYLLGLCSTMPLAWSVTRRAVVESPTEIDKKERSSPSVPRRLAPAPPPS
jgi:hypothetical protein